MYFSTENLTVLWHYSPDVELGQQMLWLFPRNQLAVDLAVQPTAGISFHNSKDEDSRKRYIYLICTVCPGKLSLKELNFILDQFVIQTEEHVANMSNME